MDGLETWRQTFELDRTDRSKWFDAQRSSAGIKAVSFDAAIALTGANVTYMCGAITKATSFSRS